MFEYFKKKDISVSSPVVEPVADPVVRMEDDPEGPLPAGLIENGGRVVSADRGLVSLACAGWQIKQEIELLQQRLKGVTDRLQNSLAPGSALTVDGVCRVTLSERQTFKLTDPSKCEALLGGRFDDLVSTEIEYTPTDKLKDMVLDPDHPLAEGLRACFAIKNATVVTFRPAK